AVAVKDAVQHELLRPPHLEIKEGGSPYHGLASSGDPRQLRCGLSAQRILIDSRLAIDPEDRIVVQPAIGTLIRRHAPVRARRYHRAGAGGDSHHVDGPNYPTISAASPTSDHDVP